MEFSNPDKLITGASMLHDLVYLPNSTTLYLESIKGAKLEVEIISQSEIIKDDDCIIERVSKLFFNSPDTSSLYCVSYINKSNLLPEEYKFICEKNLPLGKLFVQLHGVDALEKKNIHTTKSLNGHVAEILKLNSEKMYKKTYDFWVDGRKVGVIEEFFNEESLLRI